MSPPAIPAPIIPEPAIPEPVIAFDPNEFANNALEFVLGTYELEADSVDDGINLLSGVGGLPELDLFLGAVAESTSFTTGSNLVNFLWEIEDMPGVSLGGGQDESLCNDDASKDQ